MKIYCPSASCPFAHFLWCCGNFACYASCAVASYTNEISDLMSIKVALRLDEVERWILFGEPESSHSGCRSVSQRWRVTNLNKCPVLFANKIYELIVGTRKRMYHPIEETKVGCQKAYNSININKKILFFILLIANVILICCVWLASKVSRTLQLLKNDVSG